MNFITDENGATAIEYGLIAALVSIVIIGALGVLGTNLTAVFDAIAAALAI
jgi:pilus assembly protein Flp/PilA